MKKGIVFIINTQSGSFSGKVLKAIEYCIIQPQFANYYPIKIFITPNNTVRIEEIVKTFIHNPDIDRVVAIGGDGTVSAVANGLRNSSIPFGVVPIGTGNDFARAIRCSRNVLKNFEIALYGEPTRIDMCMVNELQFLNSASVGFDAAVVQELHKQSSRLSGSLQYAITALLLARKKLSWKMQIHKEGASPVRGDFFFITIANGSWYGGGMKVAPYARIDDGNLDMCAVRKTSFIKQLPLLPALFCGIHHHLPFVSLCQTRSSICIETEKPIPLQIDGEFIDVVTKAKFSVIPAAVSVIRPVA